MPLFFRKRIPLGDIRYGLMMVSIIIFLSCMQTLSFASEKDDGKIVEFGSSETPPYWSDHLPYKGLGGEILDAISREVGLTSRINFYPTSRIFEMKTGNHLGDPGHWPKQKFVAVIPIAIFNSSLFYYTPHFKNEFVFKRIEDLKGHTIGILKGSMDDTALFAEHGIRVEESYKRDSLFKKLKLGRIDLCGVTSLSGIGIVKKLFPDEVENFAQIPLPRSVSAISIMIDVGSKNAEEIAKKYEKGLNTIMSNGKYLDILEKYYGQGNIPMDWFRHLDRFKAGYKKRPN